MNIPTISKEEALPIIKTVLDGWNRDLYPVGGDYSSTGIKDRWILGCCGISGLKGMDAYSWDPPSMIKATTDALIRCSAVMCILAQDQTKPARMLEDNGWVKHGPSWLNHRSRNTCQMWVLERDKFIERWEIPAEWWPKYKDDIHYQQMDRARQAKANAA